MSGNTKECGRISPATVGFWADMDNPYVTYDNNFIESEWWASEENLGQGTSYTRALRSFLTAHVVEHLFPLTKLHRDIRTSKNVLLVVRFKVKGEDAYIPCMDNHSMDPSKSNMALCVNPE